MHECGLLAELKTAYILSGESTENNSFKSSSKTLVKAPASLISITDWSGKKDIKEMLEEKILGLSNEEVKKALEKMSK